MTHSAIRPLHPLNSATPSPRQFTYPFFYEPHPLAVEAAEALRRHLHSTGLMATEGEDGGKMFGVLVVEHADGDGCVRRGFLAAYSGLLGGRNDWDYFVPPIFDAQRPDGHFKRTERAISAINEKVRRLREDTLYAKAKEKLKEYIAEETEKIEAFRKEAETAKRRRDERRRGGETLGKEERDAMTRESQYMKAELRRRRKSLKENVEKYERDVLGTYDDKIGGLLRRRREMSDELQRWLFTQYRVLNARGEERDLMDIFRTYTGATPPAGAGDCCAPKLLQYAYAQGLRPICMAEFWWGASPASEIRHHLAYYPACRSKCLPILTHMLKGLDVEPNPLAASRHASLPKIVYEDSQVIVVDKPCGMLSVPGKETGEDMGHAGSVMSAEEYVGDMFPSDSFHVRAVHRLDMDTSGLLVMARTSVAYTALQRQFASREVEKRYEALLDGVPSSPEGRISLPLRADLDDRPRQCVDMRDGKAATTDYRVMRAMAGMALVSLTPHTGRTHQLRVHCAHPQGLHCPIVGDPLYGKRRADRMYLHAAEITFRHPVTGETLTLSSPSGFGEDLEHLDETARPLP